MSHLVVVEVGIIGKSLPFPMLAKEPLTCLSSFAEKVTELYKIRQYGYYPEYGGTLFEIIVDWGEHYHNPGPRPGGLGEILEPPALQVALDRLQKQYEAVLEASVVMVRHEGRVTRCTFKPKGEYLEPPSNTDWTDIDPLQQLLV